MVPAAGGSVKTHKVEDRTGPHIQAHHLISDHVPYKATLDDVVGLTMIRSTGKFANDPCVKHKNWTL